MSLSLTSAKQIEDHQALQRMAELLARRMIVDDHGQ
jgi:hypothetical protein